MTILWVYESRRLQLTIFVFAEMIIRGIAGLARTGLVVSTNAELIHHFLFEAFNFSLGCGVGGFHYFDPIDSEFVLHLDGIVSDRSPTVALRFLPFQRHTDVIIIEDLRLARLTRFVCRKYYMKLTQKVNQIKLTILIMISNFILYIIISSYKIVLLIINFHFL